MSSSPNSTYGTVAELEFVEKIGLGEHSDAVAVPRLVLLKRYQKAIQKRNSWNCIDAPRVMVFLEQSIENEGLK